MNTLNQNTLCSYCGRPYPHQGVCPARGKKCNNCNKMNHFAIACRSRNDFKKFDSQQATMPNQIELDSLKINSNSFPFNIISNNKQLIEEFKNVLFNNYDANFYIRGDDSIEIKRKKNSLQVSSKFQTHSAWFESLQEYLLKYEYDNFKKFMLHRDEANTKIWSSLIKFANNFTSLDRVVVRYYSDFITVEGTINDVNLISEKINQEIQNKTAKLYEFKNYTTQFANEYEYVLLKAGNYFSKTYKNMYPSSNLNIQFNDLNQTISFRGVEDETKIVEDLLKEIIKRIRQHIFKMNTTLIDFLLSGDQVLDKILTPYYSKQIHISRVGKEEANNKTANIKISTLSDNEDIFEECFTKISNNTKLYEFHFDENQMKLINKDDKFARLLAKIEADTSLSNEKMLKKLNVDLNNSILTITGEKNTVERINTQIESFFQTNKVYPLYLSKLTYQDIKFLNVVSSKEIQLFAEDIKKKLSLNADPFEYEFDKKVDLDANTKIDYFKIKILADDAQHLRFKNFLDGLLEKKVQKEFAVQFAELNDSKFLKDFENIEKNNGCVILAPFLRNFLKIPSYSNLNKPIETPKPKPIISSNYMETYRGNQSLIAYYNDPSGMINTKIVVSNGGVKKDDVFDALLLTLNESYDPRNNFAKIIMNLAGEEIKERLGILINDQIFENGMFPIFQGEMLTISSGNYTQAKWFLFTVVKNDDFMIMNDCISNFLQECDESENKKKVAISLADFHKNPQMANQNFCNEVFDSIVSFLTQLEYSFIEEIHLLNDEFNHFANYMINISKSSHSNIYIDEFSDYAYKPVQYMQNSMPLTGNSKIKLIVGSIVDPTLKVDAIVNSTHKELDLSNGFVSLAILKAAGQEIQNELKINYPYGLDINSEPIAVSSSGNLVNLKWIFHCYLSEWNDNQKLKLKQEFETILESLLIEADQYELESIAFPAFGCGTLKYPKEDVCHWMFEIVNNYLNTNVSSLQTVYFVMNRDDAETIKVFQNYYNFNSNSNNGANSIITLDKLNAVNNKEKSSDSVKFTLISNSLNKIENTINDINKLGSKFFSSEELEDDFFSTNLDQTKKHYIEKICLNNSTRITWHLNSKKILLSGFQENNIKSYRDILKLIRHYDIEEKNRINAELMAHKIQWQYYQDNVWHPHNIFINNQLEKSFNNPNKDVKILEFLSENNITFVADTSALIQYKRDDPNTKMNLRRVNIDQMSISFRFPEFWKENNEQNLISLNSHENEFNEIKKYFYNYGLSEAVGTLKRIISIQRIQNKRLYIQYCTQREEFNKKYKNNGNELRLFHGTSSTCVSKIWINGFNRSYAGKNGVKYGKGVYFSNSALYSHEFTDIKRTKSVTGHMFLSKVLVGSYTLGNDKMNFPPHNTDTTVDNIAQPSIFVIYHDAQAYPEYLLTYE